MKLFQNYLQARKKRIQMVQAQRYYKLLRAGVALIQFIQRDMDEMKKKNMNRSARRRWEKELNRKGQFSPEIIQYYAQKIEAVERQIAGQLKPQKMPRRIKKQLEEKKRQLQLQAEAKKEETKK